MEALSSANADQSSNVRGRYSIGRLFMADIEGAWQSIDELLKREGATVFTKKVGLLYLRREVVRRHVGKNAECRPKIEKAIGGTILDNPASELIISRDRTELIPSRMSESMRVETYGVAALVIKAVKKGGERFDLSREKHRLRTQLDIENDLDRRPPEAWFGFVNLPPGSGAAGDIANAFDEALDDRISVGPLQII